ncbi:MAG: DNA primase [Bacteroidales bacterium]|nr:DNA primase [Bacteroidales bacterium]
MIDPATISRIFDTADIVDVIGDFVSLKKRGVNYIGLCPFHNEKTPSFTVSPSKGIYKCFGCGRGGNVVNFIMEYEHLGYPEALRYLAKKYNIEIEERELTEEERREQHETESLFTVTEFAKNFFIDNLYNNLEGISIGLTYFKERGFIQETLKTFDIGYCPGKSDDFSQAALKSGYKKEYLVKTGLSMESGTRLRDRFAGRVIFPIHSLSGRVQGFGGRVLKKDEKTAKYVNSPESPVYHKSKIVYGIYQARKAIMSSDKCYLVEGYTDVLSLHQNGVENVVASSGTSLTQDQIRLIRRFTKNITILYDGDPAGINASLRGIDLILEEGLNVKVLLLPEGEDPDSFSKKHTAAELKDYLDKNEEDFIHFKTRLLAQEAQKDPVARARMIQNIVSSIAVIPDSITRSVYLKESSTLLDVNEDTLYFEINKIRRKKAEKKSRIYYQRENFEKTASAKPQPVGKIDPEVEYEKQLVRLLLLYGPKEIITGTKPYKKTRMVAEFIIEDLKKDDLQLKDPLYKKIYEEYIHLFQKNPVVDIKRFVNHPDEKISSAAADLISNHYQISKIWSRYENYTETEEMKLSQIIPKTVLSFKKSIIEQILRETSEALKNAQEKGDKNQEDFLMEKFMALNDLKMKISLAIGPRTIQP